MWEPVLQNRRVPRTPKPQAPRVQGMRHERERGALMAARRWPRGSYVEIEPRHVGKALFEAFGRRWPVSEFIGRITKKDIGKRVFLTGSNVLQVENDEQREERRSQGNVSDRETIQGHVDVVIAYCGEWPDDPPEDVSGQRPDEAGYADVLAAHSYVNGWANALDMTALELFDSLGVEVP
jgi:hypothetical protein